jgi:hypothetical protein
MRAGTLVAFGRFDDALAQYRDIEKLYGLQFSRDAFAEAAYAKFIASPACKGWLK